MKNRNMARYLLSASLLSTALASSVQAAATRSTIDRPDDRSGNQIHVMYVVPSDGTDRSLDTTGTIATSVSAIERWFEDQSGGRQLRFDLHEGELDITFHRLGRTNAQIASFGPFVRDEIEKDLKQAGFNQAGKIYAVYYDGRSTFSCGGGFWPPTLPGNVVALYLKGEPPGAPACATNEFASSPFNPAYWEFAMLHEILHGLGVVARCAPHHTLEGHVSDDPRDLMYAGPQPWQPSLLDAGNDDYFQHEAAGCLDLEDSPFLVQSGAGPCIPSSTTLCIDNLPGDSRFQVDVAFRTGTGPGLGRPIPLQSLGVTRGGLFWFFSQDNPELLLKILDGCVLNGHFWIFYSAGTNVELTITVTDTATSRTKTYTNPLNTAAPPVQDTRALACN
jgi:hypothetical protein